MIGLLSLSPVAKATCVATMRWKHYWIATEKVMVSLGLSSPCGALPNQWWFAARQLLQSCQGKEACQMK
jgi:hypothetical protein